MKTWWLLAITPVWCLWDTDNGGHLRTHYFCLNKQYLLMVLMLNYESTFWQRLSPAARSESYQNIYKHCTWTLSAPCLLNSYSIFSSLFNHHGRPGGLKKKEGKWKGQVWQLKTEYAWASLECLWLLKESCSKEINYAN